MSKGMSCGAKLRLGLMGALLAFVALAVRAQSISDVQEWGKRIQSGESIAALGTGSYPIRLTT